MRLTSTLSGPPAIVLSQSPLVLLLRALSATSLFLVLTSSFRTKTVTMMTTMITTMVTTTMTTTTAMTTTATATTVTMKLTLAQLNGVSSRVGLISLENGTSMLKVWMVHILKPLIEASKWEQTIAHLSCGIMKKPLTGPILKFISVALCLSTSISMTKVATKLLVCSLLTFPEAIALSEKEIQKVIDLRALSLTSWLPTNMASRLPLILTETEAKASA